MTTVGWDPNSPPSADQTYTAAGAAAATGNPLDQVTAGAPPAGGARSKVPIGSSLGIKKGYVSPRAFKVGTPDGSDYVFGPSFSVDSLAGQPARYFLGDNWDQMPPDGPDMWTLQQHLIQIGLLAPGGIIKGQKDIKSATAMAKLMAVSNGNGSTWQDTLAAHLAAAAKGDLIPAGAAQRNPLVVKLTDPTTLKQVFNNASKTLLHGTYLDPGQLDQLVSTYQGQEQNYQTQTYQATGYNPETGQRDLSQATGTDPSGADVVVKTPSPDALALDTVRQQHPNELAANAFTDKLGTMLSALGKSGP